MSLLARAQALADELLLGAALEVDASGVLPRSHLDALAAAGLYGMSVDEDVSFAEAFDAIAAVASGCLSTALVMLQHQGVARNVVMSPLADAWLADLASGRVRASVAGAALRPRPPKVTATPDGDGFRVDGPVPWMTGHGLVDVVLLAARDGEDIVWLLLDAGAVDATPLSMLALGATGTVSLAFDALHVPGGRFVRRAPYADVGDGDGSGLVVNGALSIGVARRCCALIGDGALDGRVAAARDALLAAPGDLDAVARARAEASHVALDASARLVAAQGSRGVLTSGHPQRLAREALALLAFGQRPAIREALLNPPSVI